MEAGFGPRWLALSSTPIPSCFQGLPGPSEESGNPISLHSPIAIHVTFTVYLLCIPCRDAELSLLVVSHSPLSSSPWPGPRISASEIQINKQGWALVPPTWLCDLGQASFPLWA